MLSNGALPSLDGQKRVLGVGAKGAEIRAYPSRMAGRLEPRLWVLLLVPFLGALVPSTAQDFLPFHTAATLVRQGGALSIYLPAGATSLFDAAPSFVETSLAHGQPLGVTRESVTAFLAPPPALLVSLPFTELSYAAAARLWALLQAACASLALWLLSEHARRDARFVMAAILFGPMAGFAAFAGQSGGFLLLAAAAPVAPRNAKGDALIALGLGLAIAFKLWPALALFGLVLLGRRRAALWTLGVVALLGAATWLALPHVLFAHFVTAARALAAHVVPDTNNLSLESLATRALDGVAYNELVVVPEQAVLWARAVRLLVFAAFVGAFVIRKPSTALAHTAVWLLALLSLPLVWSHYLVIAPALLAALYTDAHLASRVRTWTLVTLASVGLFAVIPQPGVATGALLLANLVACVLAACWLSPRRRVRAAALPGPFATRPPR